MTREEAIKYLEQHGFISDDVKDMCIEALEKQIPKKPIIWNDGTEHCPCCEMDNSHLRFRFCVDCGQKLDWSGKNEINRKR